VYLCNHFSLSFGGLERWWADERGAKKNSIIVIIIYYEYNITYYDMSFQIFQREENLLAKSFRWRLGLCWKRLKLMRKDLILNTSLLLFIYYLFIYFVLF
jgi:hypothetical protein